LSRALVLKADHYPVWTGQVDARSVRDAFEFKYVLLDGEGRATWERDGDNRRVSVPGKHIEVLVLRQVFGDYERTVQEHVCSFVRCQSSGDGSTTTRPPSGCGSEPSRDLTCECLERVLETMQVDPAVRFGRFHHEPGAFEERYKLHESNVLGTGMSGGVCAAVSKITGAEFAVKTLRTDGLDAELIERVTAEVQNQLLVDHPNICRLVEVFEEPGRLRLVMERMQGPDLFDHLQRKGRYTERDAAGCIRQVVAAVACCHRHGVCHRDLKLENFCLESESADARVKLIDFGLSSVFDGEAPMTSSCGTLYYVAPEVLRRKYDIKCDMWSVGVLAFILLSGTPPFRAEDDRETCSLIRKGRYTFDPVSWANISKSAKDFVVSLLEVDVSKRLDADAALAHPWLADSAQGAAESDGAPSLDPAVLRSMRDFSKSNALKRAVLRAVVPTATAERVAELVGQFEALDHDSDGKVAIQDLALHLVEHGGLSTEDAADLSAALAEAGKDDCMVSFSAFLAACMSASVTFDRTELRSLFDRLDTNRSGTVSFEDVASTLGAVVDVEELWGEFAGRELTYNDFRWLMSMPGHGPSVLELRQLLGAFDSIKSDWNASARGAKAATMAEAIEAARRENVAWRASFPGSPQRGADTAGEASPRKRRTALCLESLRASASPRAAGAEFCDLSEASPMARSPKAFFMETPCMTARRSLS